MTVYIQSNGCERYALHTRLVAQVRTSVHILSKVYGVYVYISLCFHSLNVYMNLCMLFMEYFDPRSTRFVEENKQLSVRHD